jgi:hypothetical protein
MAATIIFVATYFALALGRLPGLWVDRMGAAIIGASLKVAANVLTLARTSIRSFPIISPLRAFPS